jgi:hypothetical protein
MDNGLIDPRLTKLSNTHATREITPFTPRIVRASCSDNKTLFDHSIFSTRASRIGRHANLKVHASGTATRKTMLFDYDYKLSLPRISVKMMHVRPYRQYAKVPLNGAHMGQAH